LRGIQVQLRKSGGGTVANGANVVFDTVVNDQSLNLNYAAGVFNVLPGGIGNYYVTWWIDTNGAGPATNITFEIQLDGGAGIPASAPFTSGQLNGSALVTVGAAPATITLVNVTGRTVNLATTPVQANIIIIEVD
jgi:hypothetical protein